MLTYLSSLATGLRTPILTLAILAMAGFALAACGNDDGGGPARFQQPTPTTAPDNGDGPELDVDDDDDDDGNGRDSRPLPGGGGGGSGTVVVDGTRFAIGMVERCEPFNGDDDLDLFGLGDGIQVFVYITEGRWQELDIQGRAVDGLYGNMATSFDGRTWHDEYDNQLPGPPLNWSGNRVSGSMTLYEIFDEDKSVDVSIDLPVPSRVEDC